MRGAATVLSPRPWGSVDTSELDVDELLAANGGRGIRDADETLD